MKDDKLKKIAQLTGIDQALIEGLGVENLSEEKIKFLEGIVDMYSSDKEEFEEYINQSGLANIAGNLKGNEINSREDIEDLKKHLSDMVSKSDYIDLKE